MVVWAVDALVALDGHLVLNYGKVYHFNNVVSLQRKCCEVAHRLVVVLEFDDELVVLVALNDFLNHRDVVGPTLVIFETVVEDVFNEVELYHPAIPYFKRSILFIFLDREEQERVDVAIFDSGACVHVLTGPGSKSDCF
jgi:hypothetical protein